MTDRPKTWEEYSYQEEMMAGEVGLRQKLLDEATKTIDILLAKRGDYGTKNIEITGRYGLSVRMQDKVSRLLNLTDPGHDLPPRAEPLEDSYRDLIGYALIGLVGEEWGL